MSSASIYVPMAGNFLSSQLQKYLRLFFTVLNIFFSSFPRCIHSLMRVYDNIILVHFTP